MAKEYENVVRRVIDQVEEAGGFCVNVHGSGFTKSGVSDILALIDGTMLSIEAKAAGGRPSARQFEKGLEIVQSGGIFVIAYEDFDLSAVLDGSVPTWVAHNDGAWAFKRWPKGTSSTTRVLWSDDQKDDVELSYGEQMALQRVEAKANNRKPTPEKVRRAKVSEPNFYPMDSYDGGPLGWTIHWDQNAEISGYLVENLQRGRQKILRLPTGTGKTVQAVRTVGQLQEKLGRQLQPIFLAPRKVIEQRNWEKTITSWNIDHPENQIRPLMIETYDRFARCFHQPDDQAGTRRNLKKVRELMGRSGVVVCDEFHNLKRSTSKRSKAYAKFKDVFKLGVTATPFTNDPVADMISYLVYDGLYSSKTNFEKESGLDNLKDQYGGYMVYDKKSGLIDTYRWPYYDQMMREISHVVYSPEIDMSDVTMPEVTHKVVYIDQDPVLDHNIKSLVAAKRDGFFETPSDFTLSAIATVGQSDKRLDELVSILQAPETRQPLIFYWHDSVKDAILQRLASEGIEYQLISGSTRLDDVDLGADIPTLIQYQSGSEGIEIPYSNTSIFYQHSLAYVKHIQAVGRNVRRGHDHSVTHYTLVSPVVTDLMAFHRVQSMGDIDDQLMDHIAEAQEIFVETGELPDGL